MTQLVKECEEVSKGGCDCKVASGGGRMRVTMDRYEVWPQAYQASTRPGCYVETCKNSSEAHDAAGQGV